MLRTLAITTLLFPFALACNASPPPAAPPSGPSATPPPEEPSAPPPAAETPAEPVTSCADLGGSCVPQTATVACGEWRETPDCGANHGCCISSTPTGNAPPSSCHWKVGDTCFDSAESACAAAGCTLDTCIQLKSMPVQVRCPD